LHGWTDRRDVSVFGADADSFDQFVVENSELGERLHPNLANRGCEVVWAARHEMARTVEDVLARRTRALFLNANASIEAAPRVAQLMAGELGRDGRWQSEQVAHFRKLANGYTLFRR
jgi:glycerol-3-phosphate dehydrogenase